MILLIGRTQFTGLVKRLSGREVRKGTENGGGDFGKLINHTMNANPGAPT